MSKQTNQTLKNLCFAGVTAALYFVLTLATWSFASGAVQCRLSEALCVLPLFFPSSVWGLTLGCFLSNLLGGALWQDVVFGTLATLIGALGGRLLRKHPYLVPLPTVIANSLIVPLVLAYAYHAEEGLWFLVGSVFLGETLSAYVLGILLLKALEKVFKGKKL